MQTRDELVNDLIEALQISSAYRQQQERQLKEQVIHDCENYLKRASGR